MPLPNHADGLPVNASHTHATPRDRWRRYGALAVSLAERARHGASYNPLSESTIQDPYPVYARLRRQSPVHRSSILGSWLISRHEDVLAIARDHERFSNDPRWRNATASGAPARPRRLQHPARRPARAHAPSQGRGAGLHPIEAPCPRAAHRGPRRGDRRTRRKARTGGVDERSRAADGDAGDAPHARHRRGRGGALASVVHRPRTAARDDRDPSRAKDRPHHRREHHRVLPRAHGRTRPRARRGRNQLARRAKPNAGTSSMPPKPPTCSASS